MSDITFFDVFYGQFTIAVAEGGGDTSILGHTGMCLDMGLLFQLKSLNRVEGFVSRIPEPGRISGQLRQGSALL